MLLCFGMNEVQVAEMSIEAIAPGKHLSRAQQDFMQLLSHYRKPRRAAELSLPTKDLSMMDGNEGILFRSPLLPHL